MPKRYAMVGGAGYVAPKHMEAIKATGGQLVAIFDPNDSIGIIDSYFPNCQVFNQWYKFHKAIKEIPLDFFVICSPNNHHRFHIEYGLAVANNVICEKPLVIDPAELDDLEELIDIDYSFPYKKKTVYPVLQLRDIRPIDFRQFSGAGKHDVNVKYHTPRGHWYSQSWKFNPAESGGLLMNIGIHLFDFLIYQFGKPISYDLDYINGFQAAGYLELEWAKVVWELSIDPDLNPRREIKVNGQEWDLSQLFKSSHTLVYKNILAGKGHNFRSTRNAIELVHAMNDEAKGHLWADFENMQ